MYFAHAGTATAEETKEVIESEVGPVERTMDTAGKNQKWLAEDKHVDARELELRSVWFELQKTLVEQGKMLLTLMYYIMEKDKLAPSPRTFQKGQATPLVTMV